MKMKSVISVLLLLTLLFPLASCSALREKRDALLSQREEEQQNLYASNTVTVTVPEGTCCEEAAKLLEENGVCPAEEFLAAANDPANLSLLRHPFSTDEKRAFLLEGYIFPDTYEFYLNSTGQAALTRFLENANAKLTDDLAARAEKAGFTLDEIITIASIIQEEAGDPANMPGVSSVIHNRLQSPDYPYIQCDVAVKYLENNVKPHFSEEEYSALCELYNINKKRRGLPAGPITNPGLDAIGAALAPDSTPYYFFVTDSESNYYFAETYEEHCANCHTAGIAGY